MAPDSAISVSRPLHTLKTQNSEHMALIFSRNFRDYGEHARGVGERRKDISQDEPRYGCDQLDDGCNQREPSGLRSRDEAFAWRVFGDRG